MRKLKLGKAKRFVSNHTAVKLSEVILIFLSM